MQKKLKTDNSNLMDNIYVEHAADVVSEALLFHRLLLDSVGWNDSIVAVSVILTVVLLLYNIYSTAETRIKEPKFLGDIKALICCLFNPYIMSVLVIHSNPLVPTPILITVSYTQFEYWIMNARATNKSWSVFEEV